MSKKPKVEITIPVYNEQEDLEKCITTLAGYCDSHMGRYEWRIVIADNASTDNTLKIAQLLVRRNPKISVIHLPEKGRGRAVKHVWSKSAADYVGYMDVDLSTDLKHLPAIIGALERGYDIAIGSRNAAGARVYGRSLLRTITSKGYIVLIKLFFWVHFSDAQCGFKAVNRRIVQEIIPHIRDNGWFFDTELLVTAEKAGYRIYDEPVTWIDNPGSTVRVMRTVQGDLEGLWRLFLTRPWKSLPVHA